MHPADWIRVNGHGALADLARAAGKSYGTVHAVMTCKRPASGPTALAIEAATQGKVTVKDLLTVDIVRPGRPKRMRAAGTKRRAATRPRRTRTGKPARRAA